MIELELIFIGIIIRNIILNSSCILSFMIKLNRIKRINVLSIF